jgi:hypothetical protein
MARRRPAWEPNPETMLEDLLALVQQQRADTWERRHAALAKRRAEAKARSQAIGERRWAEQVAARRAKQAPGLGRRLVDHFVRVMEPGNWYARNDIAGREKARQGRFLQAVWRSGIAERSRNPAWDGKHTRNDEPHWLYRLTPKGEALRTLLIMVE